jgi:hypothetical protein
MKMQMLTESNSNLASSMSRALRFSVGHRVSNDNDGDVPAFGLEMNMDRRKGGLK